ncbi:MAG TPA: FAD-dependent thymidylate synthase [Firmicutes bacterium]|nr:FAD-dependent thymidylate synthase [Bacillota bacterium]
MRVDILHMTPNPLKVIWTAARTCYSHLSPQELWASDPSVDDMLRIARKVFTSGHLSVVEHCSITYAVSGVSRTLLAQYSRHRIGVSLSVQSQRHVSEVSARNDGQFDYVVPPGVQENSDAARAFEDGMKMLQELYDRLCAFGIRAEDARFVLPGAAMTNFVTTVNLRSLLDLYNKRVIEPGAQWEIKALVERMVALAVEREPWLGEFIYRRS